MLTLNPSLLLGRLPMLVFFAELIHGSPAPYLPEGVLSMELTRIVNQSAYGTEIMVGTPPQRMIVNVDTGSPFTGLQGTHSNWCEETPNPCKMYGSYDNDTSSTSKYINDKFFDGLSNFGSGDHIRDVFRIAGETFDNLLFGMITYYGGDFPALNPNAGLIGLTPLCNGTNEKKKPCDGYLQGTTLPQKFIKRGTIKRNLVAFYLGEEEPDAKGEMLFGGIDRAKQKGQVVTLPTIPGRDADVVYYKYMAVRTNGTSGPVKNLEIPKGANALLDTGNPVFDLPGSAFRYAKKYFGFKGPSDLLGAYTVDCKFREQQPDNATLLVGFEQGLVIEIPFNRLVTQRKDECVTYLGTSGNYPDTSFGDPFIRSTYVYFDYDATTVTLSNVKYTDETDIVIP